MNATSGHNWGFRGMGKNPPANAGDTGNAGDMGLIPELGRSSGVGNGNLLQYFLLEKSHVQRSLVGYSPWGRKESVTIKRAHTTELIAHAVCLITLMKV